MCINKCPSCNKQPKVDGYVKCDNDKCLEFGDEYLIHEWQQLKPATNLFDQGKFKEIFDVR